MISRTRMTAIVSGIFLIAGSAFLNAQEGIPWLDEYTHEMTVGKDTYQYGFSTLGDNGCKVKFTESVTDRKGDVEKRSWIFYLSDIDPNTLRFDAGGKSIEVTMESVNSQSFISLYEEGEFEEYTDEMELTMTEVDLTRDFIESLREHIGECSGTEVAWDDREAALDWLAGNIGEAMDDDVRWTQEFSRGDKPHLARLASTSMDDGEEEAFEYLFDLSDIHPAGIELEVSGRTLAVEVPVKKGEDFIEVTTPEEKEYTDELRIYADDIEAARQIVYALEFVVSHTEPVRPEWSSYSEALTFVQEHLGEVQVDEDLFENSLEFEDSPSGLAELTVRETDPDGETEEVTYAFYLADMAEEPVLEVSGDAVTVEMETRDDLDYIMELSGDAVDDYASDLEFPASGIDLARDLINAFAFAIANSREEIEEFTSVAGVNGWMLENLVTLYREGETYEQSLLVSDEPGNLIEFDLKVTEDDGEVTESRYLIYPSDISMEQLEIDVNWGRLNIPLETEEDDYIKKFENGTLDDFTDEADVYFSDPLVAKNFMAAIRFLHGNAVEEKPDWDMEEALSFLTGQIPDIELEEEAHAQMLEVIEGENCKMRFTRVETDDDGEQDEYIYEFMAQDIHEGNSEISVDGMLVEVLLQTAGNEELIKPYENGEVEDFEDEFTVYVDDVRLARQILAAFGALSEACE